MATKYEKLEAEYQQLSTPEQQWAWVLAHKDEVFLSLTPFSTFITLKRGFQPSYMELAEEIGDTVGIKALLSVLGIEVEEV